MKNKSSTSGDYTRVLKFLELQRRSLKASFLDEDFMTVYSAILKHLSRLPKSQVEVLLNPISLSSRRKVERVILPIDQVVSLSLNEIEKILNDPTTPRKLLEAIAVGRFHFPMGSVRSLSNLDILRDRIRTMMNNERSHETIRSVAHRTRR